MSQATDDLHMLVRGRPACREQMAAFRDIDLVFDRDMPADSVDVDFVVP